LKKVFAAKRHKSSQKEIQNNGCICDLLRLFAAHLHYFNDINRSPDHQFA